MWMKLMVMVLCAGVVGGLLLGLRHRRLYLMHEMTRMHEQMEQDRKTIWQHQVTISEATTPQRLAEAVRERKLDLEPATAKAHHLLSPWHSDLQTTAVFAPSSWNPSTEAGNVR